MSEVPLQARVPRPPLLHRMTLRQLLAIDIGIACVLMLVALWRLTTAPRSGLVDVCLLAMALAVTFRRRFDVGALALFTVALAVSAGRGSAACVPLVAIPMYQVAASRDRSLSIPSLFASVCVLLVGTAAARRGIVPVDGTAFAIVVIAIAAWFLGDSVRVRRVYVAGLADQAALRQREVVERAQRSLAEERLRIARELHDVVAHSLSVIAVQSGVGRHVIDDDPDEAKRALHAVETTSRAALQELRRLLGVLRSDSGEAALAPAPSLAALGPLTEQVRAAGVPVELSVELRETTRLSASAELSVYRVVQEALTNVVKHAGSASVQVQVRDESDALVVEVVDDGAGPVLSPYPPSDTDTAGHHGILGMRERLALFGGTLDAGFRPEGGFGVRARLPLDAAAR